MSDRHAAGAHVRPLAAVGLADARWVGSKAACLGELARRGWTVPPGFCVTRRALRESLPSRAGAGALSRPALRKLLLRSGPTPAVRASIVTAYRALVASTPAVSRVGVAVRSSAATEDGPTASFAGQFFTALGVGGAEGVVRAVTRCWASAFAEPVHAYASRLGSEIEDDAMAVVVQRMVGAERSGLLCTINPLTGNPDEVMIESTWGLCAPVAGGRVIPDVFVASRDGTIRSSWIARKRVALRLRAAAGRGARLGREEIRSSMQARPSLSPVAVERLVRLGLSIEAALGGPQQVEWGLTRRTVTVLQARPLTGLRSGRP